MRGNTLLLALYLADSQYHSTHVCYNLTLPACPVTPKHHTWLILLLLLPFHTQKSHSHAKDFCSQASLQTNKPCLSGCVGLRFQGQVTVCLQITSPLYTNPSLPHPQVVKRKTMPALQMRLSTCPSRGKREGWICPFGLVERGAGCFEMQNSPN